MLVLVEVLLVLTEIMRLIMTHIYCTGIFIFHSHAYS
jgi:hypothetical protein